MRQLTITHKITNRDVGLDRYLNSITKIDMITPQKEVELSIRIQSGDESAINELVGANLRFVVSVAKQYQNNGLSLVDLISEGNMGLLKAAKKYDSSKGFKFISYAVWWIRQTIFQALAEQSRMVRLPVNKIGIISKIGKEASRLEQILEREPTVEELAEATQFSEDEVSQSYENHTKTQSLDSPISNSEDSTGTLNDLLPDKTLGNNPEALLVRKCLNEEIVRAFTTLTPAESNILKMFFGLNIKHPLVINEIARQLDLSPERVRQLKDKAIRKMRHNSRSKILKTYLGE